MTETKKSAQPRPVEHTDTAPVFSHEPQFKSSAMQPKTSFWLGLLTGVAAMSLVGFAVVTTLYVQSGAASDNKNGSVAGDTVTNQAAAPDEPEANPDAIRPVSDTEHVLGPKNAKITLVEYSDLQCPFCSKVHPTLKQLMTDYEGKIRWVYRHFPLESIHPQARPAAIASECVAQLGGNDKFWEFTDAIYADQTKMSADYYVELAEGIGINKDKFQTCLKDTKANNQVTTDANEAMDAGAQGTPATFVNGVLISGAVPYDQFKALIDQQLAD